MGVRNGKISQAVVRAVLAKNGVKKEEANAITSNTTNNGVLQKASHFQSTFQPKTLDTTSAPSSYLQASYWPCPFFFILCPFFSTVSFTRACPKEFDRRRRVLVHSLHIIDFRTPNNIIDYRILEDASRCKLCTIHERLNHAFPLPVTKEVEQLQ
ncbi:hypothetical protein CR513_28195, partial [Mucuna pruriens]